MHPGIVTAQMSTANQQQVVGWTGRRAFEQLCFYTLEVFDKHLRRKLNPIVRCAEPSWQTCIQLAKINSMWRFFELAQFKPGRERVEPSAIWSQTKSQIQQLFRS